MSLIRWRRLISREVVLSVLVAFALASQEVSGLTGPNVCMEKQKYNVTKRVKYRAPMAVRTYVWCLAVPPRCSKYTTEIRELTRLETEERTAQIAVCCPGYKPKEESCASICPPGRTGTNCSDECPSSHWGANCSYTCGTCNNGKCSPIFGTCECEPGWQGKECDDQIITTSVTTTSTIKSTAIVSQDVITDHPTTKSSEITTTTTEIIGDVSSTYNQDPVLSATVPSSTSPVQGVSSSKDTVETDVTQSSHDMWTVYRQTATPSVNTDTSQSHTVTTVTTTTRPKSANITENTETTKVSNKIISPFMIKTTAPTTPLTKNPTESFTKSVHILKTTSTVSNYKPREIWIKPTQKGDSSLIDLKYRTINNLSASKSKNLTKYNSEFTTPRTIIVSIIPTSMAQPAFRKLSYTNAPDSTKESQNISFTLSMLNSSNVITMPVTFKQLSKTIQTTPKPIITLSKSLPSANLDVSSKFLNKSTGATISASQAKTTQTLIKLKELNTNNKNNKILEPEYIPVQVITDPSPIQTKNKINNTSKSPDITATKQNAITENYASLAMKSEKNPVGTKQKEEKIKTNKTNTRNPEKLTTFPGVTDDISKTTENSNLDRDETFNILTEPEHITAVAGDRAGERNTDNLLSVLSIVVGLVVVLITVATLIVMMERCRRTRCHHMHKMEDIHMSDVTHQHQEAPPPYVRSIFHMPLPEPPVNEKLHYQPISTLDRNLKQFMRPVVVHTISPLMLENFRGILECHYDHLPRRDDNSIPDNVSLRNSLTAPPMTWTHETLPLPPVEHPVSNASIETLKSEGAMNVEQFNPPEPLYAEIPICRQVRTQEPLLHSPRDSLNGEAVTEL